MPTFVARRVGRFPVRVSLNITEDHSLALDRVERDTGESRGVLARGGVREGPPARDRLLSQALGGGDVAAQGGAGRRRSSLRRRWRLVRGRTVDRPCCGVAVVPGGFDPGPGLR